MTAGALALSETEQRIAERIRPEDGRALAVSDASGGLAFANATQLMDFAKMMAVASGGIRKHLRGNPGACLAICTQAVEWGMSPFAVANKSYFVNDQIAFESQLVQAVILKRAPIKGRIKFEFTGAGAKRICRAWARLADDPEEIVEYASPEFGLITPKNSPLWKADPDQQHAYYSGRALCRRHFPDVLLGVYDRDELDMPAPQGAEQARDVTPRRALSDKLDAIARGAEPEDAAFTDAADTARDPAPAGFGETQGQAGVGAGPAGGSDPAPMESPRGHTAEHAHADRIVADDGTVLKDKGAPPQSEAEAQWERVQAARAAGEETGRRPGARRNAPSDLKGDGREDELDAWLEGFDLGRGEQEG